MDGKKMQAVKAGTQAIVDSLVAAYPQYNVVADAKINRELCDRIQHGDTEACTELIVKNYRLAILFLQKYYYGDEQEDVFLSILEQFLIAAKRYDFTKDKEFSTYAECYARRAVSCYLDIADTIHIPRNLMKYRNADQTELSENPFAHSNLANKASKVISLNLRIYDDEDETELGAILEDKNADFENKVLQQMVASEIINQMNTVLKERECKIITLYYGLNGNDPHTVREIADIVHFSYQRVQFILNQSLFRLSKSKLCRSYARCISF